MKIIDLTDLNQTEPVKVLLPEGKLVRIKMYEAGNIIVDTYENEAAFEENEPTMGATF